MASSSSPPTLYQWFQKALFERLTHESSYHQLAEEYGIPWYRIRNAYIKWLNVTNDVIPTSAEQICLKMNKPGRPKVLSDNEEHDIAEMVRMYANNNTPLVKTCLLDLAAYYISTLPLHRQQEISFVNGRPSEKWVRLFCERHELKYQLIQGIEYNRVAAVTPENIGRFMAIPNAVMKKYSITDPSQVFNIDESGASFGKILGRSGKKAVWSKEHKGRLIQKVSKVKGAGDRVTVMPVICADGSALKPVIVFWGKQAHYRKSERGSYETLHDVLPPCHLYQRETPGVDTRIFHDWANRFVDEVRAERSSSTYSLLIFDGYKSHLHFRSLQILRDKRIIVVALPAHTSHILQTLDVSVFSSYKAVIRSEVHKRSRIKTVIDAFDIARIVRDALSVSCSPRNIQSGFQNTGIWNYSLRRASAISLRRFNNEGDRSSKEHLEEIMKSFDSQSRALAGGATVLESGTVKINTKYGGHVTASAFLDVLMERERRRNKPETEAEVHHLKSLASERAVRRLCLNETREARRVSARARAVCGSLTVCNAENSSARKND